MMAFIRKVLGLGDPPPPAQHLYSAIYDESIERELNSQFAQAVAKSDASARLLAKHARTNELKNKAVTVEANGLRHMLSQTVDRLSGNRD